MDRERNLGVTEARFALTLLTCLLVAIGYVALLRLSGPKDTTSDALTDDGAPPIVAPPNPHAPNEADLQPRELPLERPDDGLVPRTATPSHPSDRSKRR